MVAEEGEGVVDGGGGVAGRSVLFVYTWWSKSSTSVSGLALIINLVCNTPRQTCVLWAELWFVATVC